MRPTKSRPQPWLAARYRSAPKRKNFSSRSHTTFNPAAVYGDLLLDLREGSNGFAWACCPFHDDHNPSFCVNLESGWYKCRSSSCGQTGSSIVSFVSDLLAMEKSEALQYLEAHYG